MLIRIGNFEIDYVFRRRVLLTVGRFQMYCGREWRNPYWWFAKNDAGQPWERWVSIPVQRDHGFWERDRRLRGTGPEGFWQRDRHSGNVTGMAVYAVGTVLRINETRRGV